MENQKIYGGMTTMTDCGDRLEVSNYYNATPVIEYHVAIFDEFQHIGGKFDTSKRVWIFDIGKKDQLDEILTTYFSRGKPMTKHQRLLRTEIITKYFENPDMIVGKDAKGLYLVDINELSGTIADKKQAMKRYGLKPLKVVNNKRIYFTE